MNTLDAAYNLTYSSRVYGFSYCCGSAELGALRLENVTEENAKKTTEQYRADLEHVMNYKAVSSLIATTIDAPENYHWSQINLHLKAIGWQKLTSYRNRNSNNTVILWHYSRD